MDFTRNTSRIASVDVARLMAIFIIMYRHASCRGSGDSVCNWLHAFLDRGICNPSAIFFIFSGYFAARSDSWRKAAKNAAWCLATYVVWILLAILVNILTKQGVVQQMGCLGNWFKWFGFRSSVFVPTQWSSAPIVGTYWYLRDLMVLLLLAPFFKEALIKLLNFSEGKQWDGK